MAEAPELNIVQRTEEFPEFEFLHDYRFALETQSQSFDTGKRRFNDSTIYPNCFSFDVNKKRYFTARSLYYLNQPEVMVEEDYTSFLNICSILREDMKQHIGGMPETFIETKMRNIDNVEKDVINYYGKKKDLICLPVSKCTGEIITNTEYTIHILIQRIDSFISARGGGIF